MRARGGGGRSVVVFAKEQPAAASKYAVCYVARRPLLSPTAARVCAARHAQPLEALDSRNRHGRLAARHCAAPPSPSSRCHCARAPRLRTRENARADTSTFSRPFARSLAAAVMRPAFACQKFVGNCDAHTSTRVQALRTKAQVSACVASSCQIGRIRLRALRWPTPRNEAHKSTKRSPAKLLRFPSLSLPFCLYLPPFDCT